MSIKLKLTILFLAIALIPTLLVVAISFQNYRHSLEAEHLASLQHLTIYKADRIETYFAGLKTDIKIAQGFYNIKKNLPVMDRLAADPNNPEFLAAKKMLDEQLQQMQSVSGLSDIMLVSPQGKVVYANKPKHWSKDLFNGLDAEQKAFSEGKNSVYVSDIYFDKTEDNRFEMLLTAPASDFNGNFSGVIAFEVDMTAVYNLIQDTTGLGRTGETLVSKKIDNHLEFLNPLRHDPQAALNRKVSFGEPAAYPSQQAVQGKTGAGIALDYRGKKVIAAWRYIPSLDWGLVAKIDASEAFADVANLQKLVAIVLVLIFLLAGLMAFSIARSIAEPVNQLALGAEIIGSGNLDYKVATDSKDEIGQLSRSFDKMTHDLKTTTASRDDLNREVIERKKAEQELRESKLDLDRAQTVALVGSWRLDIHKNELTWSDEAYRIFGIPAGTSLTYEKFLASVHPDDKDYLDSKWKAALQGEKYDIEHRIIVDGQIKWVREKAELEVDKDGELLGGFGTVQDITARKQADEALRQSESRHRSIVSTALDGFWQTDLQGHIHDVNPAACRMLGYSRDELLSMKIPEIEAVENPEDVKRHIQKMITAGGDRFESIHKRKDGTTIDVEVSTSFVKDAQGERIFVFIRDITERKKAEEALAVSEGRYRRLFEAARDGILILDSDSGQIVDVNPFIKELLGYSHEELLNKKLWEIGTFKNIAASKESFLELQTKGFVRYEGLPLETKDGRHISVEFVSNVYPVDHKKVIQCNIRDITDRVQAQEALRKAHDELEIRVKERTAELAHTVETLEDEVRQRQLAEQLIKTERKRFENVLEMMPAYAVLLTPDYHVAYANHTFREWFGNDNGKKCYEFLFQRTEPCENCQTYNVIKTGKSQFWEWTGPNGHNYDIYDYPFTDTDGSPLIMEVGVDVTEHKQAQKALRSASLYARSLIEASLDPLVTISPEGKITDVNEATEAATGITRNGLIGNNFLNYFTEPQKASEGYRKVISDGFVTDYPLTIRHVSGSTMDVLYNATVYKNEAGEIQGVFAAARDVTQRKTFERKQAVTNALLELFAKKGSRKEYLDSTVEALHQWSGCEFAGIRIKDSAGNIPYESYVGFDKEFLSLENNLHLERDNCVCIRAMHKKAYQDDRKYITDNGSFYCNDSQKLLHSLTETQLKEEYRGNCIKKGFLSIAVVPIRYRDEILGAIHLTDFKKDMVLLPKIQFIESTIAPLIGEAVQRFNTEAELEKYRFHLEDLVKQRTEDLARSNNDLEQFAYVASHDLQEPLRAIAGFVELLKMKLEKALDNKTSEYMGHTIDGVKRMQSLINGLLEYSRIGTQGKKPELTDAKAALDHALAHLHMSISESGAKITATQLPKVNFDHTQLAQLFQNLISNAIKFRSEQSPEINIIANHTDNAWQFAVADNGIGIDQQYTERIFLIFQRLHTRTKYPGTGIGLAICKKIVERHNGKIWVESKSGAGSTFYFTIPDKGA